MTPLCPNLSEREELVLLLIGDGLGLREIAERMDISTRMARRDREQAIHKLGACSQTQAVAILIRLRVEAVG